MAVFFDWEGTLCKVLDGAPISERIAAQMARSGLTYSSEDVQVAIQQRQDLIRQGKLRGRLELRTRRDITRFYKQILELLECHDPARDLASRIYCEFGSLPVSMYEDSLPTLELLTQRGLSIGIISNTGTSTRNTIQENVKRIIGPKHIVISEEVGVHKPSKTIFLLAAARLGTHPSVCLYVGDRLEVDAIGAVQNGGYGFGLWIDRLGIGSKQVMPKGVARITSLSQVAGFV